MIAKDISKFPYDKKPQGGALIALVIDFVKAKFEQTQSLISSCSGELFRTEFEAQFHEKVPYQLEIKEVNQALFSQKSDRVALPYGTANVLYIDTPLLLGEKSIKNPHWTEINTLLQNKKYSRANELVTNIISESILEGDVEFDDDFTSPYVFKYIRKGDDKVFNLLECATRVKSFSIMQMLLKLGYISSKTLLVLDEPDAHLHHQWIVEYARMVVLIHKHIGTRFFIATHNPDFVRAIHYIAEKEMMLDDVNFYLARRDEGGLPIHLLLS